MLDSILEAASTTTYDFRATAFPGDALHDRFAEWVPYYKLKWAIAKVLQPLSILEVGVRYGYSAAAFLDACPAARYVGIDTDCGEFGGTEGAIEWARKITSSYSAEFIVADSQQMSSFPGTVYGLIHIDGQQDGDGTCHDMQLACRQAHYVLADGFFWTPANFHALSEFLLKSRDCFEFYCVIPGYAGELLVKINPSCLRQQPIREAGSLALQDTYTTNYYLNDCGGFQQYRSNRGRQLEDLRLRSVAAIASLKNQGRVLDLGCGRGEMAYYFALRGFDVTAMDYSAEAIHLAEACFLGESHLRKRVELICDDVCHAPLHGLYDVVVAADLIEHLSPVELEVLYGRVSQHLAPAGVFVAHTFPNLWYYKYEYARRRKVAASVGAYLSPEPRSGYESLMHINEQSPQVLRRSLRRHFQNVLLWFGSPEQPAGSLGLQFSKQALRSAPDLFAIASHHMVPVDDMRARLLGKPIPAEALTGLSMVVTQYPALTPPSSLVSVTVEVSNRGSTWLTDFPPNPVRLSYRWLSGDATATVENDGLRSALWPSLGPGETNSYQVRVRTPKKPGCYRLRLTLVQELVRWFDEGAHPVAAEVGVQIPRTRIRAIIA